MRLPSPSRWSLVAPVLLFAWSVAPTRVQISMNTLHAAALTKARAAGDSADAPVVTMEVIGGRAATAAKRFPFSIRHDQAIGARPLGELSLEHGDSVRVRFSVVEQDGDRPIGAASLLLTNEHGTVFWTRLECVATCAVLTPPAARALGADAQPVAGVVELTGSGGTYHLALRADRAG